MLCARYRTFDGFLSLINKDWICFGHKCADRLNLSAENNPSEASPIFLQFLEFVYQLIQQYPRAFEFNTSFLGKRLSKLTQQNDWFPYDPDNMDNMDHLLLFFSLNFVKNETKVEIYEKVIACNFGDFIGNSVKHRTEIGVYEKTNSLLVHLSKNKDAFRNHLYSPFK